MEENVYDVSLDMLKKLKALPERVRGAIVDQIQFNSSSFTDLSGYSQTVGGVVKGSHPFFFEIEYVKEPNTPVIMLDLEEISLDDYLDYIDEEKTLKSNEESINEGVNNTDERD